MHRQPLFQTCRCGKCYECQRQLHSEWYYRIYHEWIDTIESGGYVFFNTLTYRDEDLPHVSDFIPGVVAGSELDFPCFSRIHLRQFLTRLENRLRVKFGVDSSVFHRFICAEYGTDENHTHRPHYHLLCFVKPCGLDVDSLREEMHAAWKHGITDKVRRLGRKANYFVSRNKKSELSVSNYVAKYVQKVSSFQERIDARISAVMDSLVHELFDVVSVTKSHMDIDSDSHRYVDEIDVTLADNSIHHSVMYKKYYRKLKKSVDQFHLQSNGFGACALRDIDLMQVIEDGYLTMPDCMKVVRKIPLPLYYARKMFYDLKRVGVNRMWIPNKFGRLYASRCRSRLVDTLADKYSNVCDLHGYKPGVDFCKLARYVVYYKGRNRGLYGNDVTAEDVIFMPLSNVRYNYSCESHVELYHEPVVSNVELYPQHGRFIFGTYVVSHAYECVPAIDYMSKNVIDDTFLPEFEGYDKILDKIYGYFKADAELAQVYHDSKRESRVFVRYDS